MKHLNHTKEYDQIQRGLDSQKFGIIKSFPLKGDLVGPREREANQSFLAMARQLIDKGVPQLSVTIIESYFQHYINEHDELYPCWSVEGTPSKDGRLAAGWWMDSRVPGWNGKTKILRHTVERLLCTGTTIPNFGLNIRLLVFKRAVH